jgi:ATP-binding protein involved in chromosome partitioning
MMMGIHDRPKSVNDRIQPLIGHGVKLMSMGFLVEEGVPLIWRGPMIHSALNQFLSDVDWGSIDYLLVDLPPGTGDASLSLAQSLSLTGAVVVTTPQNVAATDVIRSIAMFEKLDVPVLGIIENMSYFVCSHCGQRTEIFGHGGGMEISKQTGAPFLGEVPLDTVVRAGGDSGQPVTVADAESPAATAIRDIASQIAATISVKNLKS